MSEFVVKVKGKEYKSGFIRIELVQKSISLDYQMADCRRRLGIAPPFLLKPLEEMTEEERQKFEADTAAYHLAATPDDEELWKKYHRLWMAKVACYIPNAQADVFARDVLSDDDLRGLVAFFDNVMVGTIQNSKNMNGTSVSSVSQDSQAST